MRQIGVGVIGTGFMGKAHIQLPTARQRQFLAQRCGHGLRSFVTSVQTAQANAQQTLVFPTTPQITGWKSSNNPAVELISVCTPNDTHAEISIAALAAGKHVWCEKPMSTTLEDSAAMAAAAASSALARPSFGYNYTKNPAVTHARHLIDDRARSVASPASSAAMMSTMKPMETAPGHGACRGTSQAPAPMAMCSAMSFPWRII